MLIIIIIVVVVVLKKWPGAVVTTFAFKNNFIKNANTSIKTS